MILIIKMLVTSLVAGASITPSSVLEPTPAIDRVICEMNSHLDSITCAKYAKLIKKYSDKYGIDWKIPVAIFQVETHFRMGLKNKTHDYGLGQINHRTAKAFGIDTERLLRDHDYAIEQTIRILGTLKKKFYTGHSGWRAWYTRYHSYTPSLRQVYYERLNKKFASIKRIINEQEVAKEIDQTSPSKDSRVISGR